MNVDNFIMGIKTLFQNQTRVLSYDLVKSRIRETGNVKYQIGLKVKKAPRWPCPREAC